MIASEGPAVDPQTANAAPILSVPAPPLGPRLETVPVPGLPPELQPAVGDILLSRAFWPWEDLGAEGIPEHWLYMSRHVQGTIAMLAVQTAGGPKLVKADPTGQLVQTTVLAPNNALFRGDQFTITENSSGVLVPVQPDQQITLYHMVVTGQTVVAGNYLLLEYGDLDTIIWEFDLGQATPQPVPWNGFKLPVGQQLKDVAGPVVGTWKGLICLYYAIT